MRLGKREEQNKNFSQVGKSDSYTNEFIESTNFWLTILCNVLSHLEVYILTPFANVGKKARF